MTDKTRVPKGLFTTTLDEIATSWHKNPRAPDSLEKLVRVALVFEGFAVAESLLLAPKVSFRVFGENVVLCRLIEAFGVDGMERLLEEGAIDFVLWRPMVAYIQTPIKGVFPLAAGNHSSAAHVDPEASVEMGLKGWSKHPYEKLRRVAKLATERTWLPDEQLPHTAVAVVRAALEAGRFEADGLPASLDPNNIPDDKRAKLSGIGDAIVEASVVLNSGQDFRDAHKSWESLVRVSSTFQSSTALHETSENVLRLEGLPNITALMMKGVLKHEDVVALRSSEATAEFRRWLWSQPVPTDAKEVGAKYLAAMKPGTKLTDKTWFKTARVSTMSIAQTVAGAALGGAVLGTPGVVAGGVLSLAASLADAFGLERLLKGDNPRRFADEEIRPRVADMVAKEAARAKPAPSAQRNSSSTAPTPKASPEPSPANRRDRRAKAAADRRAEKAARKKKSAQKARARRHRHG